MGNIFLSAFHPSHICRIVRPQQKELFTYSVFSENKKMRFSFTTWALVSLLVLGRNSTLSAIFFRFRISAKFSIQFVYFSTKFTAFFKVTPNLNYNTYNCYGLKADNWVLIYFFQLLFMEKYAYFWVNINSNTQE